MKANLSLVAALAILIASGCQNAEPQTAKNAPSAETPKVESNSVAGEKGEQPADTDQTPSDKGGGPDLVPPENDPSTPVSVTKEDNEATNGKDEKAHKAKVFTTVAFKEKLESGEAFMVDCWATWCKPCLQLAPTIEELAGEYEGRVIVGKLNVDEEEEIAAKYSVNAIPAMLFFKDGELVDKLIGLHDKKQIAQKLEGIAK